MQKNRIITDWLEKYGNPKIEKQVEKELRISDVSSRAYRINKAREIYENISSLYDTFDTVGNDDLQKAKTLITNYIMKLQQC